MNTECLPPWEHEHAFGQDQRRLGERRTHLVILLTAVMMVAEIVGGLVFGSMALLADGLHMASHTVALGIAACAYAYTRRHARDPDYCFGTGKVNALGGFAGAVLLAVFAFFMAWESVERFFTPISIAFNWAILVAVTGLVVNAVSALLLSGKHTHGHVQEHASEHAQDHNLRSAYLHVLADALTSVAAIVALLAGKYLGLTWMDPAMGVLGSLLVARWSVGLLKQSSGVLLDRQAPESVREALRQAVEADTTDRIADLHLWSIGPGIHAALFTVLADEPRPPGDYRARIPQGLGIVHATIEVQRCTHAPGAE